jgi:BirA family biotin operon repressor/biotin-[acetyl-CoA-carboxylase] ligase
MPILWIGRLILWLVVTLNESYVNGFKILYYDRLDSTQLQAARLIQNGYKGDFVIACRYQEEGRGRLNRSWVADPDTGVLSSIAVDLEIELDDSFFVNALLALCVIWVCEMLGVKLQLKWPNDVIAIPGTPLVTGDELKAVKKMGGLLSEVYFDPGSKKINKMILGIGVNLYESSSHDKAGLSESAISLSQLKAINIGPMEFLSALIEKFAGKINEFGRHIGFIRQSYKENLYTLSRSVQIELSDNKSVSGVAKDITNKGALIIESDRGQNIIEYGDVIHCNLS